MSNLKKLEKITPIGYIVCTSCICFVVMNAKVPVQMQIHENESDMWYDYNYANFKILYLLLCERIRYKGNEWILYTGMCKGEIYQPYKSPMGCD